MKLSKLSRTILVSSAGLALATLLTSCEIVTIDYLFVANSAGTGSSSSGEIQTFDVDSESGAIRNGAKPVSSGGNNPVAIAVTADYNNLYVVNQASNNVAHFAVADTGALTQKDVVTTGASPIFVAVNTAGTYLYVVSGPNPAMLTAYSLSGGTIGSVATQETLSVPGFTGDTLAPTAVTVLANNDSVYVTAYDQSAIQPRWSDNKPRQPRVDFRIRGRIRRRAHTGRGQPMEGGREAGGIGGGPDQPFCICDGLCLEPDDRLHDSKRKRVELPAQWPVLGRKRTNVNCYRPARQVHLRFKRALEYGDCFHDLPGHRDSDSNHQHHGQPDKLDRYRSNFCDGRCGAGAVRIYGKLPGQFDFRIPAESGYRSALADRGRPLSLGLEAGCGCDSAARQPRDSVGNAVAKRNIVEVKGPAQQAGLFAACDFVARGPIPQTDSFPVRLPQSV